MTLRGTVLKKATKYASKFNNSITQEAEKKQLKQLKKLLNKAKGTEFGKKYGFSKILKSNDLMKTFADQVPIYDYNLMFQHFWHKTLSGVADVSWPGVVKNFALTSGTTGAASKRVPVSNQMIQTIKKVAIKQMLGLGKMDLPADFYDKQILFLGGSTELNGIESQMEGDLSGILTGKVPAWIAPFSKPEKEIRALSNWGDKIDEIVKKAPEWDLGVICGVPSWVQILLEKIIDHYGLSSIYEIWPNLKIYIHGGVNFDPYMPKFNDLLNSQAIYLDTYLCSEGFFAFQSVDSNRMQLLVNSNVFYEFIPFDTAHYDEDGELINSETITINEVEEGIDYALIISTCAGAWRYQIGDTIRFLDKEKLTIKITGRTKHFLNLCGEHLSVDNMTEALTKVSYKYEMSFSEFAIIGGISKSGNFRHTWYIGSAEVPDNVKEFRENLDYELSMLNTDYLIERNFALEELEIKFLPNKIFYDFMKIKDKYGAQHKFPRVLKGKMGEDWLSYLEYLKSSERY